MKAPRPAIVAAALRTAANTLDDTGNQTRLTATVLAARGYPTSTLGNGSRSSDTTTSTERAALNPGPWADIDNQLDRLTRTLWHLAITYTNLSARILAHAPDDDPIPAGTGSCLRCTRFCRPTGDRPENRIRAGLCPTCYRAWLRAGRPDRSTYLRTTDEDVA